MCPPCHVSALCALWSCLQTLSTMCSPCVRLVSAMCPTCVRSVSGVRFSRASKPCLPCPPCVCFGCASKPYPAFARHAPDMLRPRPRSLSAMHVSNMFALYVRLVSALWSSALVHLSLSRGLCIRCAFVRCSFFGRLCRPLFASKLRRVFAPCLLFSLFVRLFCICIICSGFCLRLPVSGSLYRAGPRGVFVWHLVAPKTSFSGPLVMHVACAFNISHDLLFCL